MGCEAHPDTDGHTFECSGNLAVVFDPYYVGPDGKEYTHWNGAPAFQDTIPTTALHTEETVLTAVRGRLQTVEAAGLIAVRSEQ